MLAKTEPEGLPPPPVEKRRIITLTNARPVAILESQWPVIAEGSHGYCDEQNVYAWGAKFYVRRSQYGRLLVYGKYTYSFEPADEYQVVRVGRLLGYDDENKLEATLLEVGNEMRSRIIDKKLAEKVVHALDDCFAKLEPRSA